MEPWSVYSIRDCWTHFWGELLSTRPWCCGIRFTSVSNVVWPVRSGNSKRVEPCGRELRCSMTPRAVRDFQHPIDPFRNEWSCRERRWELNGRIAGLFCHRGQMMRAQQCDQIPRQMDFVMKRFFMSKQHSNGRCCVCVPSW